MKLMNIHEQQTSISRAGHAMRAVSCEEIMGQRATRDNGNQWKTHQKNW